MTGCVTKKEVIYKKIYFADTNGVTTTIYYPKSFKKDLRTLSSLHIQSDKERWKYKTPKDAPDDGVAKEMKLLPIDLSMDNPHPYLLNQKQWSDKYHNKHPECTHVGNSYQ